MAEYVHPGWVHSKSDGDRHWITGAQLIRLYGLNPATTKVADQRHGRPSYNPNDRHFYPRSDGRYGCPEPGGSR